VKYYPVLSRNKLESELSTVYRCDPFALFGISERKCSVNSLSEMHKLVEIVLTTPVSTVESER
jgi:hypothetical protein